MKISDFFTIDVIGNQRKVTVNWDFIWNIPEFNILKTTPQSPKYHSESPYVDGHVIRVIEECVKYIEHPYNQIEPLRDMEILLLASIFHDVGKCNTTFFKEKDGLYHHYGHEVESKKISRRILWDLDPEVREPVCSLVRHHMDIYGFYKMADPYPEIIKLSYSVPSLSLLERLYTFDTTASIPENKDKTKDVYVFAWFLAVAAELGCLYAHSRLNALTNQLRTQISTKKAIDAFVYIGLPGAGKDTHIEQEFAGRDCEIISRDLIRIELGFCKEGEKYLGTNKEEEQVTKRFDEKMVSAAEAGKSIIINNTNLKKKYRDGYKNLLKDYNVVWHYIYVEAATLQDNINRRDGQIDPSVFYKMIETFDYPSADEYKTIKFVRT